MESDLTRPSLAEIWRKYDAVEQRLSAPLSERMLDLAGLQHGMHVLDLATGRGEPAIPAAQRVQPGGSVLGLDSDRSVLKIAQEKADLAGVSNLNLAVSDVETLVGVPQNFFDVALARWGLMYLQRPVQALRAIRDALTTDGVLVAAVWTAPEQASFFELPRAAMARIVERQPDNHDEPSTFYYANLGRLNDDLKAGGFTLKHSEALEVDVMEVSSDEELITWARTFGMWRLLANLTSSEQTAWGRELVTAAEPYRTTEGTIRLGGVCRLVVAAKY